MGKRLVALGFFAVLLLGAGTGSWAEEISDESNRPPVSISVVEPAIEVKKLYDLIIEVDHPRRFDVDLIVPESQLHESLRNFWSPRSVKVKQKLGTDGLERNVIEFHCQLKPWEAGIYIVPPFEVRILDEVHYTEPLVVRAGNRVNGEIVLPLLVDWRTSYSTVYVGQSFPVFLEVRDQETIRLFTDVEVEPPRNAFFEPSEYLGDIHSRVFGPATLYTIPAASYLVTPSSAGTLTLAAARVRSGAASGASSAKRVRVVPVPTEISATNAIGRFTMDTTLSNPSPAAGETVSLRVSVTGTGNLNYLQLPVPQIQGLEYLEKRESQDIRLQIDGYAGYRETEYLYTAVEARNFSLVVPDFAYLDPQSGAIDFLAGKSYEGRIAGSSAGKTQVEAGAVFPFLPMPAAGVMGVFPFRFDKNWWNLIWFLPGPVVGWLLYFLRKRKKRGQVGLMLSVFLTPLLISMAPMQEIPPALERADEAYRAGRYSEAMEHTATVFTEHPRNYNLAYNLSIYAYQMEQYGHAVKWIRDAVYLHPLDGGFRNYLGWLEGQLELERQIAPVSIWYPGIFLVAAAIFWTALGVILPGYLVHRQERAGILPVLCVFLIGLSGLGFSVSLLRENQPVAVVTKALPVRQIPREQAESRINIPEGLAVKWNSRFNRFIYIETAYDFGGWIEEDYLIETRNRSGF